MFIFINIPRSRQGGKYGKYKRCLSILMLLCIKQHLKHNKTEAKLKKNVLPIEKACILNKAKKFDDSYELLMYKKIMKTSYLHKPEAAIRGVL